MVRSATLITVLLSTAAHAETAQINNLPAEGTVTLYGTVAEVENEREFTLRDESGTIDVDIDASQSVSFKVGDRISVTGLIDSGIAGTDINANSIYVRKSVMEGLSEVMEGAPGISIDDAQAYSINELPDDGMVKFSGLVTEVDNSKAFTLQDQTGMINVDIESAEYAALTEGAEVTVIGNVNDGLLSKAINAAKVIVLSNSTLSQLDE